MKLCFLFKNGPYKGIYFPLRDALKIGRNNTEIIFADPSVSTKHAHLKQEKGLFYLFDDQSKNGTRINGEKIKKSILKNKDLIQIGEMQMEVVKVSQSKVKNIYGFERIFPHYLSFKNEFLLLLKKQINVQKRHQKKIELFPQPIGLKILKGIGKGNSWSLCYGPRYLGPKSLEFPLFDEELPDLVCVIKKNKEEIILEALNQFEEIFLNEKKVKKAVLKNKDLIKIQNTLLQVEIFNPYSFVPKI